MAPTCGTGQYSVQIKTYDITAPTVYKCMTQQEYDSYRAQIYQQDHGSDWIIGLIFLGAFGIAILAGLAWAVIAFVRNNRSAQ